MVEGLFVELGILPATLEKKDSSKVINSAIP